MNEVAYSRKHSNDEYVDLIGFSHLIVFIWMYYNIHAFVIVCVFCIFNTYSYVLCNVPGFIINKCIRGSMVYQYFYLKCVSVCVMEASEEKKSKH